MCVLGCALFAAQVDVAGAAPRVRGNEMARGHRAAAGEVLVRMRPGAPARAARIADDPAADVDLDEPIGRSGWRLVRSRSRTAENLADVLRRRTDVEAAEPNFVVRLTGTPDDLGLGATPLWALQNTGQRLENGDFGTPGVDLDAPDAWDITQGSKQVVIATIDTGVMQTHADLAANLWSAPRAFSVTIGSTTITCAAGTHGFNVIARTCDPADDNGHGTHVAGSIGAVGNNAAGVVGINWTTSIMALKFMDASGTGYVSDAINAIEFALQVKQIFGSTGEADIRVLNNSWTGGGFSRAFEDEIAKAAAAGMLFVASAGNTGMDHEITPVYPADYSGANVLAVAATDYRDQLALSSDFGAQHVHVAAPGVLIYSTALSAANPEGTYETRSGTSMAAAYASGVAGLVLSHCQYGVGALRDAIVRSAIPVGGLASRTQSGGRINAAAAVRSCDQAGGADDIVIHATDTAAADRHGAWSLRTDAGAAGGQALVTSDGGWSSTSTPLAQPVDYFDARFSARADVPYHVWVRLKASGDSKWNDSVWLQFSDARVNDSPAYALNSTSALAVNLENCSGCGVSGWGWQDGAYWLEHPSITFGTTGIQTVRVQIREDGVAVDQIVVSAVRWATAAPGAVTNDATILPRGETTTTGSTGTSGTSAATPYSGTPISLPGTVQAEAFDNGGEGLAYHDADSVNAGGVYRADGVDIEIASGGGYNVGWIGPGEWLGYSVTVQSSGTYTAQFRVASSGLGGIFHLDVDGVDVTGAMTIPDTGGWQNWTTISRPVALTSGAHVARLVMEASGVNAVGNIDWFAVGSGGTPTALPGRLVATAFDSGGEGVAYHDDSPGNSGGALRTTDVDIEPCAEGGYNVGWIAAGEWLRFSVDVAASGSYSLRLRLASPDGGGAMHVLSGGRPITGSIAVPRTGAWQAWTTVTVPVTLAAGAQALTAVFDTGGFNLSYVDVAAR